MAIVFFSFLSRPDGKCIYKRYYKKPVSHTIPACYSCKIPACCMQQNNKPEFQRNIKLEFSQTCHNFNQSLRNTGKLSIFKEYAIQYNNKMEESLGSIWHKKDAASIKHDYGYTSTANITHMTVSNFLWLSRMLLGVPSHLQALVYKWGIDFVPLIYRWNTIYVHNGTAKI